MHGEAVGTCPYHAVVLGIGNILLSDDGIGVHVANAIRHVQNPAPDDISLTIRDGGTIGLSLLAEIDPDSGLVAVDAMEMGAPPGSVRVFVGPDMDRQLEGTKKTAHEVALADLIQAARLAGCAPRHRALVAVQPASTEWGLEPTPAVNAAIPEAVRCVLAAIGDWAHE